MNTTPQIELVYINKEYEYVENDLKMHTEIDLNNLKDTRIQNSGTTWLRVKAREHIILLYCDGVRSPLAIWRIK